MKDAKTNRNRVPKLSAFMVVACLLGMHGCGHSESSDKEDSISDSTGAVTDNNGQHQEKKRPLEVLKKTYPEFFSDCVVKGDTVMIGSETLILDDGREKDFMGHLDDADIDDMFAMQYTDSIPSDYLMDAGRSRCEMLFKLMYGRNASEVRKHLVKVDWLGESVWFNSRNGAADSLRAVASELQKRPELRKHTKSSGTFFWREVRGAKRLSAHSYGIAIDIGIDNSNYWRWDHPQAGEFDRIKYRNRMPMELVEVFERHGFIWGGRWYHYDTMHFEFRPEILEYNEETAGI